MAGAATPALAADATTEELLRRLDERDAVIRQLEARIERLEQLADTGPQQHATTPEQAPTAPAAPLPVPAAAPPAAAEAPPPPAPADGVTTEVAEEQPRAGQLEVDPEAAERALERTLVLTGDLLLPPGQVDVEPVLAYAHTDNRQGLNIVFVGDDAVTDRVRVRRDEVAAALGARVGLPFDSQFELSVPYEWVNEETSQTLLATSDDNSGSGIGDIRVGLAKTLVREQGWIPDLIARGFWDTDTGRDTANDIVLDSGFNELGFSLSALKRQDPLAFTARFSYERAFENDNIRPGDTFGFGVAAFLAASPETSLSLGFDAAVRGDVDVDGTSISGSDQNTAALTLGASSVLARNVFLNAQVSAGLTEDTPDYAFLLSVPVRFSIPDW